MKKTLAAGFSTPFLSSAWARDKVAADVSRRIILEETSAPTDVGGYLPLDLVNGHARAVHRLLFCLLVTFLGLLLVPTARANVYATDIRLNGALTDLQLGSATNVNITYILNEPATAGVTISITSGATLVQTITLTNTSPGTLKGANLVVWDGTDLNGTNVGMGTYAVSITAFSDGFGDWTRISDDSDSTNYVWEARGIAVNKNPTSPYYGRIFVGNVYEGPSVFPQNPNPDPGDLVGLLKRNADGSPAEEGVYSSGGWSWATNSGFSPWKIEVAADDRVYISDQTAGVILSFDETLSSGSRRVVLTTNNFPTATNALSGPCLTGSGTNMYLWVTDTNYAGGTGIRRWDVGTNGAVATNDLGTTIIQAGEGAPPLLSAPSYSGGQFHFTLNGSANASYIIQASTDLTNWSAVATNVATSSERAIDLHAPGSRSFYRALSAGGSDLDLAPYDIAVDSSNRIYTIQLVTETADPAYRVFRFPAYGGTAEAAADWKIGNGDDVMRGAYGIAVDPGARYVAVAFIGSGLGLGTACVNGAARVFETTNGAPVVTLTPATYHDHTDVAWDNVGNLYVTDDYDAFWRVFSPPGTNEATTVAVPRVQIGVVSVPAPMLSAPAYSGGQFQFTLNGQASVSYIIQASPDLHTWTSVATNVSPNAVRPISLSAPASRSFYRALIGP